MLPEVSRFYAELGQNLALFAKYKALPPAPNTPRCRRRASASSTTRCATSACPAPNCPKTRSRASRPSGRTAAAAAKFSENLLDATNAHAEWSPTKP
jgi:oligopeptidase A